MDGQGVHLHPLEKVRWTFSSPCLVSVDMKVVVSCSLKLIDFDFLCEQPDSSFLNLLYLYLSRFKLQYKLIVVSIMGDQCILCVYHRSVLSVRSGEITGLFIG